MFNIFHYLIWLTCLVLYSSIFLQCSRHTEALNTFWTNTQFNQPTTSWSVCLEKNLCTRRTFIRLTPNLLQYSFFWEIHLFWETFMNPLVWAMCSQNALGMFVCFPSFVKMFASPPLYHFCVGIISYYLLYFSCLYDVWPMVDI